MCQVIVQGIGSEPQISLQGTYDLTVEINTHKGKTSTGLKRKTGNAEWELSL